MGLMFLEWKREFEIGKELGTSVADGDLGLWGSFKLDLGWMRCDGIPAAKRTFNLHQHMQNPQHSRSFFINDFKSWNGVHWQRIAIV
jgi:hypothetical protein